MPSWPEKGFATLEAARAWVESFVGWYNEEQRHSGIRYVTPGQVSGTGLKDMRCLHNGNRCMKRQKCRIRIAGPGHRATGAGRMKSG